MIQNMNTTPPCTRDLAANNTTKHNFTISPISFHARDIQSHTDKKVLSYWTEFTNKYNGN